MPLVPKGDRPCDTCWFYSKRHCLSPFECTDALSAKRRDRAHGSDCVASIERGEVQRRMPER